MSSQEFEDLLSIIETEVVAIKYDFEIAEKFSRLLDEHKDSLTDKQKKQLEWEFLLFRLTTKNRFLNNGLKTERFVPMATYADGSVFPNPNSFPKEAFLYFSERAKNSNNSILKARYLDVLWEKSEIKNKYTFGMEAIEQYLLNLDSYQDEEAIIERLDGLQRAAELVLILESKRDSKPLTDKVISRLNEQIEKTLDTGNYRWLLEMFELVIAFKSFYTKEQIRKFVSIIEKAADSYHSSQNYHLQRSFLNLKKDFIKAAGESIKPVENEIGESYIDEAEAKSGSGLVKVHFLQEAIEHFSKLGEKEKVQELVNEVKIATKQAINNKEFKEISATVEIKKEDTEKMKASLGVGKDVPFNIGTVLTFFPNWNHAVDLTKKLNKKYIAHQLFPVVHYSDKYPVGTPQTPEQMEEDQVMHNFKIEADLAINWLTGFTQELIKEKKVSYKDFKVFFKTVKKIDKDSYETILIGIRAYFKGEHFQATSILAPQLEDFLRTLLRIFGGQTTTAENGGFREKTLGSILTELEPSISHPLYRYIDWVMRDYRGYNLRNNTAHGLFKRKHGNPMYSTAIIHIFCWLIAHLTIKGKK